MDKDLKTMLAFYENLARTSVSEAETAQAKEKGYLFDYPNYETHQEIAARTRSLAAQIDPTDIANAFLFSLSTRRLEYRSALGSYYYAKAIPEHDLTGVRDHCYLCGWYAWKNEPDEFDIRFHSLNIFNYERFKYGGVRHTLIDYALFDLEQFLKLPKVIPSDEDKRLFAKILSCVESLNGSDSAGKLRDTIIKAKILKTNKSEVSVLLGELGICGILAGNEHPSYDRYFASEGERGPVEYKNDFEYPVNRWQACDGVNTEKLIEVFGDDFRNY